MNAWDAGWHDEDAAWVAAGHRTLKRPAQTRRKPCLPNKILIPHFRKRPSETAIRGSHQKLSVRSPYRHCPTRAHGGFATFGRIVAAALPGHLIPDPGLPAGAGIPERGLTEPALLIASLRSHSTMRPPGRRPRTPAPFPSFARTLADQVAARVRTTFFLPPRPFSIHDGAPSRQSPRPFPLKKPIHCEGFIP